MTLLTPYVSPFSTVWSLVCLRAHGVQLPAKPPAQHNAGKQVGSHSVLPHGTHGGHGGKGGQGTYGTYGIVPQGIVDLATIGSKITALQYETPWDFALDVNRITENSAYFYNDTTTTTTTTTTNNNNTDSAVDEKKDHNAPPSVAPSASPSNPSSNSPSNPAPLPSPLQSSKARSKAKAKARAHSVAAAASAARPGCGDRITEYYISGGSADPAAVGCGGQHGA